MTEPEIDATNNFLTTDTPIINPYEPNKRVQLNDEAAKKADKVFNQITIKLTFPKQKKSTQFDHNKLSIPDLHTLFLNALSDKFSDNIKIYANTTSKPLSLPNKQNLFNKPSKHHQQLYHIHLRKHSKAPSIPANQVPNHLQRHYTNFIIHKIDSSIPFSTIIQHPAITSLMNTHHFFLSKHTWLETETEITSLGWLLHTHPHYQSPDAVKESTSELICHTLGNSTNIPKFQVVFSKPSI